MRNIYESTPVVINFWQFYAPSSDTQLCATCIIKLEHYVTTWRFYAPRYLAHVALNPQLVLFRSAGVISLKCTLLAHPSLMVGSSHFAICASLVLWGVAEGLEAREACNGVTGFRGKDFIYLHSVSYRYIRGFL